jgi:hypothetical protein
MRSERTSQTEAPLLIPYREIRIPHSQYGGFMMSTLLPQIKSPADLHTLSDEQLQLLTREIRDELCGCSPAARLTSPVTSGWSSCLALHLTFDFSRRSAHLGHRPSDLPAQADHRPVRAVPHDPHQGRADGLPPPGRKPLRPVHDRPRRVQRLDRQRIEGRRRPPRPGATGKRWPSSATERSRAGSCSKRSTISAG